MKKITLFLSIVILGNVLEAQTNEEKHKYKCSVDSLYTGIIDSNYDTLKIKYDSKILICKLDEVKKIEISWSFTQSIQSSASDVSMEDYKSGNYKSTQIAFINCTPSKMNIIYKNGKIAEITNFEEAIPNKFLFNTKVDSIDMKINLLLCEYTNKYKIIDGTFKFHLIEPKDSNNTILEGGFKVLEFIDFMRD